MSKYINEHTISVGYNNTGQEFFDTILKYRKYIHSYFFSLTDRLNGDIFDINHASYFAEKLINSDTYNIPGNILFNNLYSLDHWDEMINMVINKINLHAITILNPVDALIIKDKYPHLEVHLSVRFWDWNVVPNIGYNDRIQEVTKYKGIIDVINISGVYSYNDHELIKYIKDLGIKVKFIANEGCIVNRDLNYSSFLEFNNKKCWIPNKQHLVCCTNCVDVRKLYPWMELATVDLYKESLKYYDIDILKIACRFNDTKYIDRILHYWTSDESTYFMRGIQFGPDLYPDFLEYLDIRSKCSGHCFTCRKCKEYYEKFKHMEV